jgi:hypothetical protein
MSEILLIFTEAVRKRWRLVDYLACIRICTGLASFLVGAATVGVCAGLADIGIKTTLFTSIGQRSLSCGIVLLTISASVAMVEFVVVLLDSPRP